MIHPAPLDSSAQPALAIPRAPVGTFGGAAYSYQRGPFVPQAPLR